MCIFTINYTVMKNGIILELRSAEGGKDSKLIIEDMAAMYIKAAHKNNFSVETTN